MYLIFCLGFLTQSYPMFLSTPLPHPFLFPEEKKVATVRVYRRRTTGVTAAWCSSNWGGLTGGSLRCSPGGLDLGWSFSELGRPGVRRLPRSGAAPSAELWLVIAAELWQAIALALQRVAVQGLLRDGSTVVWIEIWFGVSARGEVSNPNSSDLRFKIPISFHLIKVPFVMLFPSR
ncbi:hypothetical protein ACQJBY_043268 [Aegilops geniculata]